VYRRFGTDLESPGFQRAPKYGKDTTLTGAVLFAQLFCASSDSLEHFFHLALLLGRDILKCTFDQSGVLAEDRNEHPASLLRERNSPNAAIALALHTANQPLLVQSIDCYADIPPTAVLMKYDEPFSCPYVPSRDTAWNHPDVLMPFRTDFCFGGSAASQPIQCPISSILPRCNS
jgi:hypothetical protein